MDSTNTSHSTSTKNTATATKDGKRNRLSMNKKKEAPTTASKKIKTNDALEEDDNGSLHIVPSEDCNISETIDANVSKQPTTDVASTSGSKSSSTSSSIHRATSSFLNNFIDLTEEDDQKSYNYNHTLTVIIVHY